MLQAVSHPAASTREGVAVISPRTVHIGDIDLAYRSDGEVSRETPIVFVHGLGEDSRSWLAQLSHFGRDHEVYAIDVRGHGGSSLGDADGSLDQLAGDLVGFLDTISGPSICVGFSMGGTIVLSAAAKRSDLVKHAVVVCSSSVVGSKIAERFQTRAEGIEAGGREFAADALRANLERSVLTRPANWQDEVESRLDAIGDGRGYANGARAMASMKVTPLTSRLPEVKCPVDVLVGELDESCPWRAAEIIVDAVPSGAAHLMPGVGHFVSIENPPVLTHALDSLGL